MPEQPVCERVLLRRHLHRLLKGDPPQLVIGWSWVSPPPPRFPVVGSVGIRSPSLSGSYEDVRVWLNRLDRDHGLSASTRRQARAILRKAMGEAVRAGKASHNLVIDVPAPTKSGHRLDNSLGI